MQIVCCKRKVFLQWKSPKIKQLQWNSYCLDVNLENKNVKIYNTDESVIREMKPEIPPNVVAGGKLFVGQEQGYLGGGFSPERSISGKIVDLLLIENFNSDEFFKNYLSYKNYDIDKSKVVLGFDAENIQYWSRQKVTTIEENILSATDKKSNKYIYAGVNLNYMQSKLFCAASNGQMPVFTTENDKVLFISPLKVCAENNKLVVSWIHMNKSDIMSPPNPGKCPYVGTTDLTSLGISGTVDCKLEACVTCQVQEEQIYTLRGICENSLFDTEYFISGYENTRLRFQGKRQTIIYFSSNGEWIMQILGKNMSAIMESSPNLNYPFGLNKWTFINSDCNVEFSNLLLSGCNNNEFSCLNGQCIDIENRCDRKYQCSDLSDESNCNIVQSTDRTNKDFVPPQVNQDEIMVVQCQMSIATISNIDLTNGNIYTEFFFTKIWYDSTIRFKNLKPKKFSNLFEPSDIWQPAITFVGAYNSEAAVERRDMFTWVGSFQAPLNDDISILLKGTLFILYKIN